MLYLRYWEQAVNLDGNAVLPTFRIGANHAPMAAHHPAYRQAYLAGQGDKDVNFAAYLKASIGEKEESTIGDVPGGGSNTVLTAGDGRWSLVANPLVNSPFTCFGFSHGYLRSQPRMVQLIWDEDESVVPRIVVVQSRSIRSILSMAF
jgi:hypothetical protein